MQMPRHLAGLLALTRIGAVAFDHEVRGLLKADYFDALKGVLVLEDLVEKAGSDFMEKAVGAFEAGSRLEEMCTATESGALGNLLMAKPDAVPALGGASGETGVALDVLMKVGQVMTGDGVDLEKLKSIGQELGVRVGEPVSPLEKLKTLNRFFSGERKQGTPEAEEFLAKKSRSSLAPEQASSIFDGAGAEEILAKLKDVLGESDADALNELESLMNREPKKKLIDSLSGLQSFLAGSMTSDKRFDPVRELLNGPGNIPKLAALRDAYEDAAKGYAESGEMWGTTDEGFAATTRLVLAAEALDGRQHELFSAASAMALKKYFKENPGEAQIPVGITKARVWH